MLLQLLTVELRFKFVLKDLVNGVPTAYSDLESLLTNSENQMQRSFEHLPSPLQKLVKQLPSKMTQSVGPEVLAAAAEKQGLHSKYTDQAAHAAEKMGLKVRVPTLKDLVTKPGAVAGMLKAIMNFLKLRFPAFLGMNVLYSLALFGMLDAPSKKKKKKRPRPLTHQYSPAFCFLVLPQAWPRNTTRERPPVDRRADQSHGPTIVI